MHAVENWRHVHSHHPTRGQGGDKAGYRSRRMNVLVAELVLDLF
jgi:hypothetical protein